MVYYQSVVISDSMFMVTCVLYHIKTYIFPSRIYVKCQIFTLFENNKIKYYWKKYCEIKKYVVCNLCLYKNIDVYSLIDKI